jgi:hypothetical protein
MSRKDKATVVCAVIMSLTLALAIGLALLQRWQEAERARRQAQEEAQLEIAEIREKFDRLKQWMDELGLPITIEEEIPAAEDEGDPPTPEEADRTSDFSVAGLTYPSGYGPETRDRWFPQGIQPVMEIYLGWKDRYPEGYARLIAWGRGEVPPRQLDPAMIEASRIAAAGQNIDDYMAHWPHSPLGGYGQEFAYAGWRHGVNPYLLISLTAAETTFATNGSTVRLHNAWCMKGPQPQLGIPAVKGWCSWPDWPTAIDGAARFLNHYWPGAQTAHQLRGYCEGNPPDWFRTVETVREAMGGAL